MSIFTSASLIAAALAGVLIAIGQASADDRPAITVSPDGLNPARLEVHVGEVVRWVAPAGQRLRITLDAHRDAHEVVVDRAREVRAVFRTLGEHWYTASWPGAPRGGLAGLIVVRPAVGTPMFPPTCGPESSVHVCIER